jgi:ribosomal protein S18 acetylase RimI-like enzyme
MSTKTIKIRVADSGDASGIAAVHDSAWMEAYRGIIPGADLNRMVERRGPEWWSRAIKRGSRIAVLDYEDTVAGYASYGRNRAISLPYKGELYELYLKPEFQGLGFGRRLFTAAQRELSHNGLTSMVVWSLADNERAMHFYSHLGGLMVGRTQEIFSDVSRERIAFGWH